MTSDVLTMIEGPRTPSAQQFFSSVCPKVLAKRRELCHRLPTSISFTLSGPGGGEWTLDFEHAVVLTAAAEDAKAHLQIGTDDFVKLLSGELNVPRRIAEGKLLFSGEIEALRALTTVFDATVMQ